MLPRTARRLFATHTPQAIIAKPPVPPTHNPSQIIDKLILDHFLSRPTSPSPSPSSSRWQAQAGSSSSSSSSTSSSLSTSDSSSLSSSLSLLVEQYELQAGRVLDWHLPYESRPAKDRRCHFDETSTIAKEGVVLVAHFVGDEHQHAITLSSGFALAGTKNMDCATVVTCAHTLEEIRRSQLYKSSSKPLRSGSVVISKASSDGRMNYHPVSRVLSSLHRSDLLLLSTSTHASHLQSLPVSPYPAHPGTHIRAHFVTDQEPKEIGWTPWIDGMWSRWIRGKVLGYRDFAGREAQPGTYDALSHLLFEPPPLPGSSGGPLVDEESGAVVGVMLGSRMDNRVEGLRGWGVPSEVIYEMFSLPGLNLN